MIYTNKGMLLATLSRVLCCVVIGCTEQRVLCDVIPCVCPLIDHGSQPMKALEFLTLLYKYVSEVILKKLYNNCIGA
jgi:nucleoside phosphorylase